MNTRTGTPDDLYTTLRAPAHAVLTLRGSRFLAAAVPVQGKEECDGVVDRVRTERFDATHYCYAYRLGPEGAHFRMSDGGEPAGTAGRPILGAIDAAGLTGVIVVVTRYFGGTKLGAANLARAYRRAAELALGAGECLTQYISDVFTVSFPHSCVGAVIRAVKSSGGRITSSLYDQDVTMTVEIRRSRAATLRALLLEGTGGTARFSGP
jgi:putative IMPACT (imprinted ancient) family translation regulator